MENIKRLAVRYGTPLLLFCPNTFKQRYHEIQSALPGVKHHYALKALPYEQCIRVIQDCDGFIDVASVGEINLVQEVAPGMIGRCIYTHPVKKTRDIEAAIQAGIQVMVADSLSEIEKLRHYAGQIRLLIRIAFPNPGARCDLSAKFGAPVSEISALLDRCVQYGFELAGCSFHVGSQMTDPAAHCKAVEQTRKIYDEFERRHGFALPVLNIGGGFPARLDDSVPSLAEFCRPIQDSLQRHFPDTEIWSEPGRALAADCMTAVSQIIGKSLKNNRLWYYLDDGVYNTFSGKLYDHADYAPQPLQSRTETALRPSVLAGPTCDSIDVLKEDLLLPEMEPGEYIVTKQVGAYGWASRTQFNLLDTTLIIDLPAEIDQSQVRESPRISMNSAPARVRA